MLAENAKGQVVGKETRKRGKENDDIELKSPQGQFDENGLGFKMNIMFVRTKWELMTCQSLNLAGFISLQPACISWVKKGKTRKSEAF